jgi:hypothetical protein
LKSLKEKVENPLLNKIKNKQRLAAETRAFDHILKVGLN